MDHSRSSTGPPISSLTDKETSTSPSPSSHLGTSGHPHQPPNLQSETYALKKIHFNDEERTIVCQTTNGACPILSIANYLSLTGALEIPRNQKQITASNLTDLLGDFLITQNGNLDMLGRLEDLHRGLIVNPGFTGVSDFRDNETIMQTFGAELLHGWLPSAEDPAHDLLTTLIPIDQDYNRSVSASFETVQLEILTRPGTNKSLLLNSFLSNYPNNLTPTGLIALDAHMYHGQLAILFYSSHFALLYKHPSSGELYTLVTDAGYLESGSDIVWESLIFGGASQFFSADFIPQVLLQDVRTTENNSNGASSRDNDHDADAALAHWLHTEEQQQYIDTDEEMARKLQKQINQVSGQESHESAQPSNTRGQSSRFDDAVSENVHLPKTEQGHDDQQVLEARPPKVKARHQQQDSSQRSKGKNSCTLM